MLDLALSIVSGLFALFGAKLPAVYLRIVAVVLPTLLELVHELENHALRGARKREAIVVSVIEAAEQTLTTAELEVWTSAPPKERRRLIGGLVDVAVAINRIADPSPRHVSLRLGAIDMPKVRDRVRLIAMSDLRE